MKGYLIGAGFAAAAVVGLTLYVKHRGGAVQVATQTYNAVDGAATDAVLSIPGMSVFRDPATGDFDPVAAGQAAGAATRQTVGDWFASTFGTSSDSGSGAPLGVTGSGAPYGFNTGTSVAPGSVLPDPIAGVI